MAQIYNTPGDPSSGKKKKKKRILSKFKVNEISLVDRPMQEPASVAILKRNDSKTEKRLALTTSTAGHGHSIMTDIDGGERQVGTTSWVDDHVHDWVMDDAGNIILADADGHTHAVGMVVIKCVDDISDILPEGGPLADLLRMGDSASDTSKVTKMPEQNKETKISQEDLDKAVAKSDSEGKRAERAEAIVKLSSEGRKYFDEQNESGQDEFLAKTSEEQAAVLKNAQAADPVIYKSLDGRELRKSDGENFVAEVKRNDSLQKQLTEGQDLAKRAGFEKRASDELGHLKGDLVAKADLLEVVATLPEDKRIPVMEILKAQDAGMAAALTAIGTSNAPDIADGAEAKLDALAKSIASDEKIDYAQAYAKVCVAEPKLAADAIAGN